MSRNPSLPANEPLPTVTRVVDGRLQVSGRVTATNVVALRQEGEQLIDRFTGPGEIDLTRLEAASSVVVSLLLCWQRRATANDNPLAFTGTSDRLRSLVSLSHLNAHLPGL